MNKISGGRNMYSLDIPLVPVTPNNNSATETYLANLDNNNAVILKILGYLVLVLPETQQRKRLPLVVSHINYILKHSHFPAINDPTAFILAQYHDINLRAKEEVRRWEKEEKPWYIFYKVLAKAAAAVLSLFGFALTFVAAGYAEPVLGVAMVVFGPVMSCVAFLFFSAFFVSIASILVDWRLYKECKDKSACDLSYHSDSKKYFENKKEALMRFIERETSDNALMLGISSVGIVKKIESSIIRSAILTHYYSAVYPSYEAYRKGHGLLRNTSMSPEPAIDVGLFSRDIKKTHQSRQ
jgi:hypothetical protein